jgi:hypothetical protein
MQCGPNLSQDWPQQKPTHITDFAPYSNVSTRHATTPPYHQPSPLMMALNTQTSTGAHFTAGYLSFPLSEVPDASPKWSRLVSVPLALVKALCEHEAIREEKWYKRRGIG